MIRTYAAYILLGVIVIMLAAQLSVASSYSCVEQCRANLSAAVNQCNQQNTSHLTYQMANVCINEAHSDYRACVNRCPGNTMGPRRLPEEQVQPLPGYMPGPYR